MKKTLLRLLVVVVLAVLGVLVRFFYPKSELPESGLQQVQEQVEVEETNAVIDEIDQILQEELLRVNGNIIIKNYTIARAWVIILQATIVTDLVNEVTDKQGIDTEIVLNLNSRWVQSLAVLNWISCSAAIETFIHNGIKAVWLNLQDLPANVDKVLQTQTCYLSNFTTSDEILPYPDPYNFDDSIMIGDNTSKTTEGLRALSDWVLIDYRHQQNSDTAVYDQCIRERGSSFWNECKAENAKSNTISRTNACSLSDGKYTKEYLPMEMAWVHTASAGFYKHNNQIYYITHTSKAYTFPDIESEDREMYLMNYNCNTQSIKQLQKFESRYLWLRFTVEYVRNSGLVDKILLQNHPYERHSNTPYEWYFITDSTNTTLKRIYLFNFYSETAISNYTTTPWIQQQLQAEITQRCGTEKREEDRICRPFYTIDNITDNQIIFTLYVWGDAISPKTYKKTYMTIYQ